MRDHYALWRENLAKEENPDRRAALLEVGKGHGWVDARGRLVDLTADPKERAHAALNDEIRDAARGRRFLPLEGERGEA